MMYNNGFYPQYYQPMQSNAYPTQMSVGNAQQNVGNVQSQPQNGGFLSVPNEDVVNSYPVGPGNCVTFKIEGKPIVMEKSMGFSQFESPKIDRYRLVKEQPPEAHREPQNEPVDMKPIISTIDTLKSEIDALWSEVEALKSPPIRKPINKKKEVVDDDSE